jgi:hypothetical protein
MMSLLVRSAPPISDAAWEPLAAPFTLCGVSFAAVEPHPPDTSTAD